MSTDGPSSTSPVTAVMLKNRTLLTRYWIQAPGPVLASSFGVTAYSVEDAFDLLAQAGVPFDQDEVKVIENIRFEDLDQNHIVPNMGPMVFRGVWYPRFNV